MTNDWINIMFYNCGGRWATKSTNIKPQQIQQFEFKEKHEGNIMIWQSSVVCSFCRGQDICDRYDYSVEFSGIGDPPTESQHVGYCSQAAIFISPSPRKIDVDIDHCHHYSLVSTKIHHIWKVMRILIE